MTVRLYQSNVDKLTVGSGFIMAAVAYSSSSGGRDSTCSEEPKQPHEVGNYRNTAHTRISAY